ETRRSELLTGEALGVEGLEHVVRAARRVADAEVRGRASIETPLAEEAASALGLRARQLAAEVLGGGGVGRVQPTASAGLGRCTAVLVVQRVADASGETLDGLGEADVIHLAQERVHVAGCAASEAVIEAHLGPHVKARALLVVERTE